MSDLRDFSGTLDGHISGSGRKEFTSEFVCACGNILQVRMVREHGSSFIIDEQDIKCPECGLLTKFKIA